MFKDDLDQQIAHDEKGYVEGNTIEEAFIRDQADHPEIIGKKKLNKLTEEAVYKYKGFLCSEGIQDTSVKLIPKKTEVGTMNAFCQFKKCLFRVEYQSDCQKAIELKKAQAKLEALKKERAR